MNMKKNVFLLIIFKCRVKYYFYRFIKYKNFIRLLSIIHLKYK